jgi:hypothetical protein
LGLTVFTGPANGPWFAMLIRKRVFVVGARQTLRSFTWEFGIDRIG